MISKASSFHREATFFRILDMLLEALVISATLSVKCTERHVKESFGGRNDDFDWLFSNGFRVFWSAGICTCVAKEIK